jgi:hypothetical protein
MYLYKKLYVKNWNHTKEENRYHISIARGVEKPVEINPTYLEVEVGYWRKANAIHKWFVENIQGGVDECQESFVDSGQLYELLGTVNEVLSSIHTVNGDVHSGTMYSTTGVEQLYTPGKIIINPEVCERLLPCGGGFFFGSTEYDEWYIKDLEDTKKILEEVLKDYEEAATKSIWYDYTYRASW